MTEALGSSDLSRLIDAYCAAWSESDAAQRREMLDAVWAHNGTYTDPTVHVTGLDQLLAHIGSVLARRVGAKVVRTSVVDAHHNLVRFAWQVVQADGIALPEGVDFGAVTADGKLQRIVGFFGPLGKR